jgi:hypothetical protein
MKKVTKTVLAAGILAGTFLFNACEQADFTEPAANVQATATVDAATVFRPFPEDYLGAQGSTSEIVPPVPDFIGWTDPLAADYSAIRWVSVDYNGTSAKYLNENYNFDIPTTVSGSIKETQTAKGVFVTITVHTENALTYSLTDFPTSESPTPDFVNDPLDFGYRPHELIANPNLQPALGTIDLSITFNNKVAGADIPDLVDLFVSRLDDVVDLSVKSSSTGTFHAISGFPEGAQGTVKNHQRGLIHLLFKGNDTNQPIFPRENITYSLH